MRATAHYAFWSSALLLQLGLLAAILVIAPLKGIVFAGVGAGCAIAIAGLIFKMRVGSHGFWAGFFGISALYGIVLALGLFGLLFWALSHDDPAELPVLGLGIGAILVQLVGLLGQFLYVFGSPHIWPQAHKSAVSADGV